MALALAAFVLPERWLPQLDELVGDELKELREEQRQFVEDVTSTRPADNSAEERDAIKGFFRFILPLDPGLLTAVRHAVETGLRELVEAEKAAQEAERQLALRHIEQAVNTLAVVMESWGVVAANVPDAGWRLAWKEFAVTVDKGELPSMSQEERNLLRFEIDLMMALASLDGPLDDLTYWAHRAVVGARRVQTMSSDKLMARWRGELARLRAKSAWVDWDDEELEKELEPWPDDLPSP